MRRSILWVWILVPLLGLNLLYTNCAGHSAEEQETSLASLGSCGEGLSDAVRSPATIDQAIDLINQLPKPLNLDCFVKSLKRPLKVFSVDSPSSLQPSVGRDNPRIFILSGNLSLSVVPKGPGKMLLEMGQKVSATGTVKGEIQFPVSDQIATDAPYKRILDSGGGTSCRTCHTNEGRYTSTHSTDAFQSGIILPSEQNRVEKAYLKSEAQFCNSSADPYRCQMLRAIFIDGQAQDSVFP